MSDDLRYERIIDAPPAAVFRAFTTDGGQQAFYGKDDPGWIVESLCDLRVGGEWLIAFGPSRQHLFRHRHVFRLVDPPRRIVMATTEFRVDGSTLEFTTEFLFADHHGRTLMTMIQTGLATAELREEHARGLGIAFDRLERLTRTAL